MRHLLKRSLAIFIAIIMVFSLMAVSFSPVSAASYFNGGSTLYLRPNSQWKMNNARFAIYLFSSTGGYRWVSMKDSDGDGYYEATLPEGYFSTVIFCRMNPEYTDNNWSTDTEDRLWNQTANLSCDGVNDCFEMTGGSWNDGTWSVYAKKLVYFVNTKNWSKVSSYCVNTSLAGDTWPGKTARLINSDLGVYACYPGNYPLVRFTDGTSEGDYSSQYNYADVAGKYIEPITGGVYTSAAEALTYANSDSAFFVNTLNWENVNGYGWTDGIGSNTAYPGTKATLINDEKNVYAFNAGDRKKVLFNDGTDDGDNTSYFTYADVKGKYIEPKTGKAYNSAEEAWTAASNNVVYFVNTLGWKNVNGYGWTNGIGSNTAYPGEKATLVNSKYSVYSYNPGDRKQVLFNDGTEDGEHSNYVYCSDAYGKYIEPKTGKVYNSIADAINASKFAEPPATEATPAPTQTTTTEPTDLNVSLCGEFNDWSQTADVFKHYGGYDYQASITVPAGTYNFKIVHEGLWHGNGATINDSTDNITLSKTGADCTLKASGGKYDFYYNTSTNKLSILYTKVEVEEEEEPAPTVLLSGSFNAWSRDDVMTSTSGTVVEKTVSLETGEYYFNIVENGSWYHTGSSIEKIQDSISNEELVVNGGVCILKATGGKYTFAFDYEKNTLTITAAITVAPADTVKVSLAGEFNNWSKTANVFTKVSNDTVSATVEIKKGTHNFKIVENEALWYGNNGTIQDTTSSAFVMDIDAGNCTLKSSGGTYTFTYKVTTRQLSVSFVPSDEDYAETAKVYLAGDFNDWNNSSDLFEYSSKNVVSKTIELAPGTYGFKLVEGGLWYGNSKTFSNTASNMTLSYTSGNCVLVATGGKYTFTYNVVDKVLNVTFVAYDIDLAKNADVCVAGEFNDWSLTANKLTRYSNNLMITTFDIKGGTYKFKIVHDRLWYGNNGVIVDTTTATSDSGWILDIDSAECTLKATGGTYTFMYNVVTNALTITAEISAEDPAKTATACVSGEFNNWSLTTNKLSYSAENTVSTTFDIPAGTYRFKIVNGGLWYGNNGTIVDTTTTTSDNGWDMSIQDAECTLKATGGSYTFNYNVLTNKLVITFVKSDVAPIDPAETATACVSGEFNNWSLTANKLNHSAENTVSTTFDIPTGTYKFKIVNDGLWYGNNGTIVDTTTTTSSNGWDMSINDAECTLKATGGSYTFNYNVVTKKLVITSVVSAEDPAKTAKVSLAGEFNGWSTSENTFTYSEENIVSTSVFLFPGTYKFKVVYDGLWYGNNGTIENTTGLNAATAWEMDSEATDCTLNVSGGTFTFNFNVVTKKLQVLCNLDDYDPAMYSDVRLVGDFNNWDKEATKMIYVDDRAVVVDVELEAGQYQFKIIEDGVWYGNNGTIPNVTTSSDIGWTLTEEEGNCTLDAQGGKYTFIYRVVPNTIIVFHNYDHNWF